MLSLISGTLFFHSRLLFAWIFTFSYNRNQDSVDVFPHSDRITIFSVLCPWLPLPENKCAIINIIFLLQFSVQKSADAFKRHFLPFPDGLTVFIRVGPTRSGNVCLILNGTAHSLRLMF